MRKRALLIVLLVAGMLVFYIAGVFLRGRYGIRIVVSNQSGGILRDVSLKVENTGPRYELGEFGPGARKHIFVQPKTESHINLEFLDPAGQSHAELVVGYAESGNCGGAAAIVQPGGQVSATESIDIFCKGSWLDFVR